MDPMKSQETYGWNSQYFSGKIPWFTSLLHPNGFKSQWFYIPMVLNPSGFKSQWFYIPMVLHPNFSWWNLEGVPRRCTRPFRCSSTQGAVPTQTLPLSVTSSLSLDAKRRVGQDEWVMKMMVKHDEHWSTIDEHWWTNMKTWWKLMN